MATTPPPAAAQSGNLQPNIAGALAYIPIVAIIWLIIEPYNKDKYVRFHAFQALGVAVTWVVIGMFLAIIPILGWIGLILFEPLMFIVWIVCAVKAYQGQTFKLPVIGNFAEQQAGK